MSNLILSAFSMTLILAGIWILSRTSRSKSNTVVVLLLAFFSVILLAANGVASYFTGNGIDEATIYHLKYGLSGAGFSEYSGLIGGTLIVLLTLSWYSIRIMRSNGDRWISDRSRFLSLLPIVLLSISLLLSPAVFDLYKLRHNPLLSGGLASPELAESFYDFYRKPDIADAGNPKKNIVFVYAESLERTYFDQTLFPGLTDNLRELEAKSTYFTNISQVAGTGWTVAGMTASQCGIPLFAPSHGNSMSGMDEFLSSAVCLGDLLRERGYELSFLGGANTDFAGKSKLLKTHGFSTIFGLNELQPALIDQSYRSGWGLYDDFLFDLAFQRFVELSESSDKFGLFTLTLDTHHPDGHPSRSCSGTEYQDAANPILNAVACSDLLIANFVDRITGSPYADKTIVVIASDHIAMWNSAYDALQSGDRKNLFMIIDPERREPREIQALGSTLDIGTTLLPFLGYSGEIGLGRDLLSAGESEGERSFVHSSLESWAQPISKFWGFPRLRNSLTIHTEQQAVSIDNRVLRAPVLIELDNQLQSTLRFRADGAPSYDLLAEYRSNLNDDSNFLLIDECRNTSEFHESMNPGRYCLIAGQGTETFAAEELNGDIRYTANDLRKLFGLSNGFDVYRVAHAGGGVDGQTYTNSFEALNHNLEKGFRFFEIDFSFTADGHLACIHDWDQSFERSFGIQAQGEVTLDEFEGLVSSRSDFKKCTAASLANWMEENPAAVLVTDAKSRNVEALTLLSRIIPEAPSRVIPQIYEPENFAAVKSLGFKNIIWSLYRFRKSNDEVMDWVEQFNGQFAVTMPKARAESGLAIRLGEKKIPTYVHTVNSIQEEQTFINDHRVTEVYTDFLAP